MMYPKKLLLLLIGLTMLGFIIVSITNCSTNQATPKRVVPVNPYTERTIGDGESLYSIFLKEGLAPQEVLRFADFLANNVDVTSIQPGDKLRYRFSKDHKQLLELIYEPDIVTSHIVEVSGDTLAYREVQKPQEKRTKLIKGQLKGTLDASLLQAGLAASQKQQVNNILSSEIDFRRLAKNGDLFTVLLEERYYQETRLPNPKILYIAYDGENVPLKEAFYYRDASDPASSLNGWYKQDGSALVQTGIFPPLNSMHAISAFGYRLHPIYRTMRMHDGIDYRGRYGTPVYAVAQGRVIFAGWDGGYGQSIQIKHSSGLITQYAHLSQIMVRRGETVSGHQRIGAVGSTGLSTGAHLHFGLIDGHHHINPTKLKMVGATKLKDRHWEQFREQVAQIKAKLQQVIVAQR